MELNRLLINTWWLLSLKFALVNSFEKCYGGTNRRDFTIKLTLMILVQFCYCYYFSNISSRGFISKSYKDISFVVLSQILSFDFHKGSHYRFAYLYLIEQCRLLWIMCLYFLICNVLYCHIQRQPIQKTAARASGSLNL